MDTLSIERTVNHVFVLVYHPDSLNQNQLLYELAKYNFSNFMVRNFDITIEEDPYGLARMLVRGFLNYDEAQQYARQLYANKAMAAMLRGCRSLIVSEPNLPLLGTAFSYKDYEVFFEQQLAPLPVSKQPLLDEPEVIIQEPDPEEKEQPQQQPPANDDPFFEQPAQQQNNGYIEFDDDFWR